MSDLIIHTYPIKNAHTKRVENIVTGKIADVYEDVEVEALSQRRVRHYNRFDALSIPIIVGKQFNNKKLSYNIGLGSEMSFYNTTAGKTLRSNEVITYTKTSTTPYHNQLQVAALIELGLGVSLTNQFEITANLRHKNYLLNWANDELSIKPQAILLGIGMKYKF